MTSPGEFEFLAATSGQRLDMALLERGLAPSRSAVQRLIAGGLVLVDGARAQKSGQKLARGAKVKVAIPPPQTQAVRAENLPLEIVYEDQYLLVVNKPRGQVVHPAAGHSAGTLVNALLAHTSLSPIGAPERPGIVQRLDKDTSGLLAVAKTETVHLCLAQMIAKHDFLRQYLAIVHGVPAHKRGTIDAPLGRDPANRKRFRVSAKGKPAVTHYEVLADFSAYALLRLQLETGRTHQIRVHLASLGHPVAGDPLYGPRKVHFQALISGQALHAARLSFVHPVFQGRLDFSAPLPADMAAILRHLDTQRRL